MRLQLGPMRTIFLQNETIILGFPKAHHVVLRKLLNDDVAANREIDNGRGDVAHVGGVIDQSADFARSKLVRRLILCSDGAEARIAAFGPPQPEHQDKNDDGYDEWPVAAEKKNEAIGRGRFVNSALVERDGDR